MKQEPYPYACLIMLQYKQAIWSSKSGSTSSIHANQMPKALENPHKSQYT